LLAELGEDAAAAAARTGLTRSAIYQLLDDERAPLRKSTLNRICAAYRKAAGEVIEYIPDPPGTRGAGIPPVVRVQTRQRPRGRPRKKS